MIVNISARLGILLVMAVSVVPIVGQNQTPPNAPPPPPVTWTDPSTGLMWAKKDNGSDVTQPQALNYCRNLGLAGFKDWRLPEMDELHSIQDRSVVSGSYSFNGNSYDLHVKGGIRMTACCAWVPEGVLFALGDRGSLDVGASGLRRALCVRRARE